MKATNQDKITQLANKLKNKEAYVHSHTKSVHDAGRHSEMPRQIRIKQKVDSIKRPFEQKNLIMKHNL